MLYYITDRLITDISSSRDLDTDIDTLTFHIDIE